MKTKHQKAIHASKKPNQIRAKKRPANELIAFTAALEISAEAAVGEGEKAKTRTFKMNAYNGGPLSVYDWELPVIIDLSGLSGIDKSRPILLNHDMSKIVGHTTKLIASKDRLDAEGIVSGAGEAANEVVAAADKGFPWQASVGVRATNREYVKAGSTAKANGQEFSGPVIIARKSVLGEISFVPLGADDSTSASVAASAAGDATMTFEQWLKAKGFTLAELSEAQKASLQAMYDAEIKASANPAGETGGDNKSGDATPAKPNLQAAANSGNQATTIEAYRAQIAAEHERAAKIGKIAARYSNVPADKSAELQAKAIKDNWDEDKVELEFIRADRPTGAPFINTGAGTNITAEHIAAACARSAGVSEKYAFQGLNDNAKEIAAGRKLRGMGIHQMLAIVAAVNGIVHTPGRVDNDFLRAMLHNEQNIRASGGFSTMSLSGITENILNKAMLEAYGSLASVVSEIAWETDTNDFKQFKRYRLTGSGTMAAVGPTGELKNMSLQDESYSNQVGTVGAIINIPRNIFVNDDMGALVQVPQLIGREAVIAREVAVFAALFANTGSFFSTTNKNYASGGGSALSISSMATARQKFVEQKDANGNPIMVMPDRVLVPPALETTADNLFQGANIVVGALGSTSSKSVEPNLNAHRNKYRPIVTPFLGAQQPASVGASGSDTAWYLLSNPAGGMATVQVGYLRGQRTPVIEQGQPDFNTLGLAMRGYFDFGVALHDYRCGVLSAGA